MKSGFLFVSSLLLIGCSSQPVSNSRNSLQPAPVTGVLLEGEPDCTEQVFEEVRVPMRDSMTLGAVVRHPIDSRCQSPTVLVQTPYNKCGARRLWFESGHEEPLFDSTDYVFVLEDMRCFFSSAQAC